MPDHDNQRDDAPGALRAILDRATPFARGTVDYVWHNKIRSLLHVVSVGLVLLIFGSIWSWLHQTVETSTHQEISMPAALQALDARQFAQARLIAERLRYTPELTPDALGGPLFVLGAAAAYEAEESWDIDKQTYFLLSAGYLEEARDRGIPEEREAEAVFLLGRSRFLSQQYASSVPLLEQAIEVYPSRKTETFGYLTTAFLQGDSPNYDRALAYNEQYLNDPSVPLAERHRALLQRARMLYSQKEFDRCRKTLALIPPTALNRGEVIVFEGRLLMEQARQIKQQVADERAMLKPGESPTAAQAEDWNTRMAEVAKLHRDAVGDFRRAQGHDNSGNIATRKALYLTGLCLIELQQPEAAIVQLGKAYRQYPEAPEGIAAGLSEADVLRGLGRDTEALEIYHRIIQQVAEAVRQQTYENPWLPLKEFRPRLRHVYDGYLTSGKYEQAVRMSDMLAMFFPRVDAMQMKAEALMAWGQGLQEQASDQDRKDADSLRAAGRKQFREAGLTHLRLARLRVAQREYPDDLWHAAQAFLHGHDYKSSIKVVEQYLKNESRDRRALALVNLGEARLALGEFDAAITALNEALQHYPKDPIIYRARLLVAESLQEKGETTDAIELLRQNLGSQHLTPDSIEWRDSLFELGRLSHLAGEYRQAIRSLEEAVERYPDSTRTLESRYLIADAYRQAADEPIKKLETVTIETSRAAATSELKLLLGESLKHYKQVQMELTRRSDLRNLTPPEKSILRNCYFARGAIFFDLGKYEAGAYEQAILAFSDATNVYQHEPEVLDAFLLIAACNRRLNKPVEARGALEQAKVVLSQIDPNASFDQTTNFSREEWSKLLRWLTTL